MKLKTSQELKEIVDELKQQRKKIVTVNGCFDLLHFGHLNVLKESKKLGDYLIVGLNSDISVKSYKGENRPIISENNRIEVLSALDLMDYIILFDEPEISIPLVNLIKPSIHVVGEEYGENCIESEIVKKNKGEIHVVKRIPGISTSELIEKIKKL